jgi:hypothetical protein
MSLWQCVVGPTSLSYGVIVQSVASPVAMSLVSPLVCVSVCPVWHIVLSFPVYEPL